MSSGLFFFCQGGLSRYFFLISLIIIAPALTVYGIEPKHHQPRKTNHFNGFKKKCSANSTVTRNGLGISSILIEGFFV
jgi:hypothetical protein